MLAARGGHLGRPPARSASEAAHQRFFVKCLRTADRLMQRDHGGRRFRSTFTCGGIGSLRTTQRQSALGYSRGVPDLLIFEPSGCGNFVAMAIEMKRFGAGRVTAHQQEWIDDLVERRWNAIVAWSWEDALAELNEHLM